MGNVIFVALVALSVAAVALLGSRHSLRFWRFVQPSLFADEMDRRPALPLDAHEDEMRLTPTPRRVGRAQQAAPLPMR